MANLSQKTILLLDKLYNLKGSDNIILQEIISTIEGTENNIDEVNQRQRDLEQERNAEETDLLVFTNQQETFLEAFSALDDNTFDELRKIGVDVSIGSMVSAVKEKAPNYIEDLQQKIYGTKREINEEIEKRERLERELEDLKLAKEKAEADRNALVSLMEQSLSTDVNERRSYPPKYAMDILSRFGVFDAGEITTLTKAIMFPEDGLEEYDKGYEERLANGLVGEAEVIEPEEKEEVEEKEEPTAVRGPEIRDFDKTKIEKEVAAPIIIPEDKKETSDFYSGQKDDLNTSIIDLSGLNGDHQEEVAKEEPVKEFLESLGLETSRFVVDNEHSVDNLMSELAATDKEVIKENYESLRSINADEVAYNYTNGFTYLADEDLTKKLTLLRAKGISDKRIKELLENPKSGLREKYEVILNRFNAAEDIGRTIDDEHLGLLAKDLPKLAENLRLLNENEIAIDDKELRNYEYLLTNSNNIGPDLEVLKNYLINITRSNDKYALDIFSKTPYYLITDIDKIIENNLEDVLSTNPEVLREVDATFVERVKYFEGLGKPITDPTGKNTFAKYIIDPLEAIKENGGELNTETIPREEEVNPKLPGIIGNENISATLVNALNDYYLARENFREVEIAPEAQEDYNSLMQRFQEVFHAENVGKYTWKVADGFISKNKLERHLKVLLNALTQAGESMNGIENELLLTSMLYNHCTDEETLRKMVETCLGFNEENTLGGRTL